MNDAIMLDLETLSVSSNAAVLSIGAVAFSTKTFDIHPEHFYRVINLESATGDVGKSTLKWWATQSDAARAVFNDPNAVSESLALVDFSAWIHDIIPAFGRDHVTVWGNGAAFDCVVLRNAYERNGYIPPWKWYNDRCYRTMKTMFGHLVAGEEPFDGVAHNALDDALHQAKRLVQILDKLEGV